MTGHEHDPDTVPDTGNRMTLMELGRATADSGVDDVLGMIFASQEADAKLHQSWQDAWWDQARAESLAMRHGIEAALAGCEHGGTTANYERTLAAVYAAVENARFGPIRDWYTEQERTAREAGDPFATGRAGDSRERHPRYAMHSGVGSF